MQENNQQIPPTNEIPSKPLTEKEALAERVNRAIDNSQLSDLPTTPENNPWRNPSSSLPPKKKTQVDIEAERKQALSEIPPRAWIGNATEYMLQGDNYEEFQHVQVATGWFADWTEEDFRNYGTEEDEMYKKYSYMYTKQPTKESLDELLNGSSGYG